MNRRELLSSAADRRARYINKAKREALPPSNGSIQRPLNQVQKVVADALNSTEPTPVS